MLPPRKRLKLSLSEHNTVSAEDTGGSAAVAEAGKFNDADTKICQDDIVSTLLQLEQSSTSQSASANCKKEPQKDSEARAANNNAVISACSADVAAAKNFGSAGKNSLASQSVPLPQQPQEQARRGRKPRQTPTTAITTVAQQPATVHQNSATANGSQESHVVALPSPSLVATPTPNVIHIPEDARVLQTEDGLLIICQSDGTVQIHGHTEGKPIPLDAIRSVLEMDTATFAAEYGSSEVTQETTQSPYDQFVPLTSPQTEYATVGHISGANDARNLIPVDGRQYVTVDGSQALLAYDPDTQSMVQINAGQGILTLSDGNTLVALDGSQQGAVGSGALVHLLPNSHMQL